MNFLRRIAARPFSAAATAIPRNLCTPSTVTSLHAVHTETVSSLKPQTTPKSVLTSISWNEYFRLRQQRNRIRPVVGVPFFMGGYTAFAQFYEFSPLEPVFGIDPFIAVSLCAVLAGTASYQVGAALGQLSWRLLHRKLPMDRMDKVFYAKIQHYRAEKGNSPYVRQMSNARNLLQFDQRQKNRQDFYGESIKSVNDYRHWLRRERKLTREHLGPEIQPIRGIRV